MSADGARSLGIQGSMGSPPAVARRGAPVDPGDRGPESNGAVIPPPAAMRSCASVSVPRGFETILLVENDRRARMSARDILKSRGYHVAEVASSRSALATNARHPKRFAALIANVVLPGLDGYMLAERLRAERPDLKLLFLLSGPRTPAAAGDIAMRGAAFLHKPFTAVSLSCTLRRLLDDAGRCVVRIPERVSVGVTYPLGTASPGGAALHLGARNT